MRHICKECNKRPANNTGRLVGSLFSGGGLAVLLGNFASMATGNRPFTYAGLFIIGFALCYIGFDRPEGESPRNRPVP